MSFLDDIKKKAQGQRGKAAESAVRALLEKLNSYPTFDWSRIYDARSAGGKFPSRPGDFEFFFPGTHGLIEVKEVDHDFRLPAKNFDKGQIAKLRKRHMAGGIIIILVQHTTTKKWRRVDLNWIAQRLDQPSWDLQEFNLFNNAREALMGSCIGGML